MFIQVHWCSFKFIDVHSNSLMFIQIHWCSFKFIDVHSNSLKSTIICDETCVVQTWQKFRCNDEKFAKKISLHNIDEKFANFQLMNQITKTTCVETKTFSCVKQYIKSFVNDLNIDQSTRSLINFCSLNNERVDWRMNVRWLINKFIDVWTNTLKNIVWKFKYNDIVNFSKCNKHFFFFLSN